MLGKEMVNSSSMALVSSVILRICCDRGCGSLDSNSRSPILFFDFVARLGASSSDGTTSSMYWGTDDSNVSETRITSLSYFVSETTEQRAERKTVQGNVYGLSSWSTQRVVRRSGI